MHRFKKDKRRVRAAVGDGERFNAQPTEPKEQQGADGIEKWNEESSENP